MYCNRNKKYKELQHRGERKCTPRCVVTKRRIRKSFNAMGEKGGRFSRRERKRAQ
jgi:hypothetical protein